DHFVHGNRVALFLSRFRSRRGNEAEAFGFAADPASSPRQLPADIAVRAPWLSLVSACCSRQHRCMRILAALILSFVFAFQLSARVEMRLDGGWRFMRGDPAGLAGQATGPVDPNWIDSDWQTVSLPHNWGWEDAQRGTNYYRGPGWYRHELNFQP